MIYINNETELKLTGLSVVKFSTLWCAPCKKQDTILMKMEKEFENIKIYSLDIDKYTLIAQKYRIMSVPTLIFFNGNEEKERMVGMQPTEQVRKVFKSFIAANS